MNNSKKKRVFWQFPWKHKESFFIIFSLIVLGFFLELLTEDRKLTAPPFPLNAIILCAFLAYMIITYRFGGQVIKWFHSIYAATAAIAGLVFIALFIGFVPQNRYVYVFTEIGLTHAKNSWPFLLVVVFLLTSLGYTIIHKLVLFKLSVRNFAFILNHLGLFIIIAGGTLGTSDFYRLKMYLVEGKTIDVAYMNDKPVKMPFAIHLEDFFIEEYPPKLVLVDPSSGEIMMDKEQGYWAEAIAGTSGWLNNAEGWFYDVEEYFPYGDFINNSFIESRRYGAVQAAKVKLVNKRLGIEKYGWTSCGNFWHQAKLLNINDTLALGMTSPEPKKYISIVNFIVGTDTLEKNYEVSVNTPLSYKSWRLYQTSYNEKQGRWSEISVVEAVKDSWLPFVYVGIFMTLIGGLYLLFGKKDNSKIK